MSGVIVRLAEAAPKYGATRWQIYDWRKRLRNGSWHCLKAWPQHPCFGGAAGRRAAFPAAARAYRDRES